MALRARARINLAAIERNVAHLVAGLSGSAQLCAVVKANASGHGAIPVARAALRAGATRLAVATALEAAELRAAGLTEPILILGALSAEELPIALGAGAELTAWSRPFVEQVARAAHAPVGIHVKLDTGMGRLGTRDVQEALDVAGAASVAPLRLVGAMTHLATADGAADFMAEQLGAFAPFAATLREGTPDLLVHAANSAATVREPGSHFDMVRCGIALYGCDPMNRDPDDAGLEPAMELTSYVAAIKPARAGESVGYGRRFVADSDVWIGTLPIGYADGIRRAFTNNCDVLIAGRRYPLVGTVSMDNITVALGASVPPGVAPETEAVLIGCSQDARQTAEELSNRIGSIAHEILCGISPRVVREYHRDGQPAA